MNTTTVTVGAVTYAIKLQKLLARAGIRTKMVKVESSDGDGGCTHGVEIYDENWLDAVYLMKENGIDYRIYRG